MMTRLPSISITVTLDPSCKSNLSRKSEGMVIMPFRLTIDGLLFTIIPAQTLNLYGYTIGSCRLILSSIFY